MQNKLFLCFFAILLCAFGFSDYAKAEGKIKVECPFLVETLVVLQLLPNHYPASIFPDIDDSDEGGSGRMEWNYLYSTNDPQQPLDPIVAMCGPARPPSGKRVSPDVEIEIPRGTTRCVLENVLKTPTRFWCE